MLTYGKDSFTKATMNKVKSKRVERHISVTEDSNTQQERESKGKDGQSYEDNTMDKPKDQRDNDTTTV